MRSIKTVVMCLVFFTAVLGLSAQEKASTTAVKAAVVSAADRLAANQRYLRGLGSFKSGDYEKAGAEWNLARRLDPENVDAEAGLKRLNMLKDVPAVKPAVKENDSVVSPAPSAAAPPSGLVAGYRGAVIPLPGDQLLYVKKGDRVDVLVTFDAIMGKKGETTKEKVTATILQNIIVLNVHMPENRELPGAIELLCNPVEAQYVALSVAQAGRINIVVRAPGDTELHPMEIASFRKLIK